MTPEERARGILGRFVADRTNAGPPIDLEAEIAAAIREAVDAEREFCARLLDLQAAHNEAQKAGGGWKWSEECVVEAICAAVAEERKACAWLAKNWEPEMSEGLDYPEGDTAAGIAAAIRARGGPNP